jgi:hypothetical protein
VDAYSGWRRLLDAIDVWNAVYQAVLRQHTAVETEAKQEAHEGVVKVIRPFKRRMIRRLQMRAGRRWGSRRDAFAE